MKVKIDDLSGSIMRELSKYTADAGDRVADAVDKTTKSLLKDLRQTSPSRTGDYRKGWRSRVVTSSKGRYVNAIYNKTDYQLTHLLEKGHKARNGSRVSAIPHIAPAGENAVKLLEELVEEAITK